MSSSANPYIVHLGFRKTLKRPSPTVRMSTLTAPLSSPFASIFKISGSEIQRHGFKRRCDLFQIAAMDDDLTTFDEFDDNEGISGGRISSILSASEGEESDTEIFIIPTTDADLPHGAEVFDKTNAVSVATHRFATLRGRHRKGRIQPGVFINMGLIAFSAVLLLLVDWCSWKIVRLPLPTFYLTRPFTISALLASFAGFLYIPIVDGLKIRQILRKEGPTMHASKNGTPTMGGLYFVPIGIIVARTVAGFSSIEVHGAATATIAFAAIGLLDDTLSFIRKHNYGLPAQYKLYLQLAVGTWFSFWLDSADVTARYGMYTFLKMLVPLPEPLGLVYFGKFYLVFSTFCFVAMGNGVNLTDGLDGLAGGTAALAFIGMSIAVLPICSELAIFGASMAGACIGFLMHNGYKASIFMGDIGSLALGGALAAMASCTGMFFPLLIVSCVFVLEVLSVIMQVSFFKVTRRLHGAGRRLFRMSPLHHHLELCGVKEPYIVTGAYVISSLLALLAGYVGLISV